MFHLEGIVYYLLISTEAIFTKNGTLRKKPIHKTARSNGNPEIFYAFFIEKFVTVNGYGLLLPEGPGGGKGVPPNIKRHRKSPVNKIHSNCIR